MAREGKPFDHGSARFQNFAKVMKLRNAIIHTRAEFLFLETSVARLIGRIELRRSSAEAAPLATCGGTGHSSNGLWPEGLALAARTAMIDWWSPRKKKSTFMLVNPSNQARSHAPGRHAPRRQSIQLDTPSRGTVVLQASAMGATICKTSLSFPRPYLRPAHSLADRLAIPSRGWKP
jgi:hypothetical protein